MLDSQSRIHRLPDHVINQIAAGEVVERPASIVKELVENSLDAESTRIQVDITEGGLAEIVITDDGIGMDVGDLPLAILRHATSKLSRVDDLQRLVSYGFRGEALASICSVASVEIRSRTASSPKGYLLKIAHSEVPTEPIVPVAAPLGTQIRIRDLFKEIPARQKFMRSPSTELAHAARVVRELALARPDVVFHFRPAGRTGTPWVSPTRRGRFEEILRPPWTPLEIHEAREGLEITAFLSPPDVEGSRGDLSLFINERPVRHRVLLSAIRAAYADALGRDYEPSGVLYLDIRPEWLDVNVHPQKLEVRILEQEKLYAWLLASLRRQVAARVPVPPPLSESTDAALAASVTLEDTGLRFLGVLRNGTLLLEEKEGLLVFEPHALHESSLYLQYEALLRRGGALTVRLSPARLLTVTPTQRENLDRFRSSLTACGFKWDLFGENVLAFEEVPSLLPVEKLERFVASLGEETLATPQGVLAQAACLSAVGVEEALSPALLETLIKAVPQVLAHPFRPHGRAALFRLPYTALERPFGRGTSENSDALISQEAP